MTAREEAAASNGRGGSGFFFKICRVCVCVCIHYLKSMNMIIPDRLIIFDISLKDLNQLSS